MGLTAPDDGESSGMDADGLGIAADQLRGFLIGIETAVLNVLEYSLGKIRREDGGVRRILDAA